MLDLKQPVLVQKFGGSSVDGVDRIRNAAGHVLAALEEGYAVAVVVSAPGDTTDELLAKAREIDRHPDPRELDVLLSTGEQISIALMAMALQAMGQPAISLTGIQAGIRTDDVHGKASILGVDTERIIKHLNDGKVVVVAGFQGYNERFDITTLGRGGSDLTAVALAAALKAEVCEIYTDVDGVYTADPRIVPDARVLPVISHAEMLELASLGAQVMQARSIEYAMRLDVPIRVRSSFLKRRHNAGTLIRRDPYVDQLPVVTGVTCDRKTSKITIYGLPDRPGIAYRVLAAVAEKNINVDLIIQSAPRRGLADLSFTVSDDDFEAALVAAREVAAEIGAEGVESDSNIAKISIVGAGMMNTPGVAARMFGALGGKGINIQMVGCSEIKVSCVIARENADEAVRVLHDTFGLGETGQSS